MRTVKLVRVVGAVMGAVVLIVALLAAYVLLFWDRPYSRQVVALQAPRDAAHVQKGQFLYERSLLCWDCHGSQGSHSPSEPQAGGREFNMTGIGPGFGYVYGTNVTPDVDTGIGAWSDGEVVRAIREGISSDGHLIFPVMAYQFYHGLSDDDVLSLVAYLRSLPPVRRPTPARHLSFAAKALIAVGALKPESPIVSAVAGPPAGPTATWGEYLAWHRAGCAECHSPRDPRTATLDDTRPLAGGLFPFPEEGFETTGSNLTRDTATGIGAWTEEQFGAALRTGVRPNGAVMLPFMPWPAYSQWSPDDVRALWLYLRSLPAVSHQVPASTLKGPAATGTGRTRGEAVYAVYCLTCHGVGGAGSPFTSAPLRDVFRDLDAETALAAIMDGPPGSTMPGFGKTLSAGQVADLTAFLRSW
jgi:mono/diheme cytochrome c family protein